MEKLITKIAKPIKGTMAEVAAMLNEFSAGRLKPHHITISSVLLHGFVFLAIWNNQLFQAGILLIAFGLMDAIDGSLARLQKTETRAGILLDATADRIKEVLIYTALAYWLYQNENSGYVLFAPLALGGSMLLTFIKTKAEAIVSVTNKRLSATQLNRLFSGGSMRFEVRMSILVIALLSGEILITVALLTLFVWFSAISQLINVLGQLDRNA